MEVVVSLAPGTCAKARRATLLMTQWSATHIWRQRSVGMSLTELKRVRQLALTGFMGGVPMLRGRLCDGGV